MGTAGSSVLPCSAVADGPGARHRGCLPRHGQHRSLAASDGFSMDLSKLDADQGTVSGCSDDLGVRLNLSGTRMSCCAILMCAVVFAWGI
jgi:hypothetical protein